MGFTIFTLHHPSFSRNFSTTFTVLSPRTKMSLTIFTHHPSFSSNFSLTFSTACPLTTPHRTVQHTFQCTILSTPRSPALLFLPHGSASYPAHPTVADPSLNRLLMREVTGATFLADQSLPRHPQTLLRGSDARIAWWRETSGFSLRDYDVTGLNPSHNHPSRAAALCVPRHRRLRGDVANSLDLCKPATSRPPTTTITTTITLQAAFVSVNDEDYKPILA
ncbi:hypothetical protein O3P69_007142 [Scylla paramamosain]|uniref:Uncharacterized protein n=1 Tax=Scylla paramamosain TaxID=85552 RepID=A0AAW0V4G3_SCYPA